MYDGYHFGGMHMVWWFLWVLFIFWVFATPYTVRVQRKVKDTPIEILRKRFAAGQVSKEDYQERKTILENELINREETIDASAI
jgi:putative membrane protein